MKHLTVDPYIPFALWWPLVLAAAGLLAWYAVASRRRLSRARWWGVTVSMAVAVAVPLVVLLNPTWIERIPPPAGKPRLTILVDRSPSMATPDAEGGQTRYAAACRLAGAAAGELGELYDVAVRGFAEGSSLSTPEQLAAEGPRGTLTDLAAALDDALDRERPQGQAILVLGDGIHNAPGGAPALRQSVAKAEAMAAPVYVRTIGGDTTAQDLEVQLNLPQELAFVGQRVPVVVRLRQRGSLGAETRLSLRLDDEPVEERRVKLQPDGASEEVFQVTQAESGLYRYEVRAEPPGEEVTEVNNAATLLLRVVDQPVRVLLLEGKPYWDTKFLVRTLSTDRSIELTSVVRLAQGRLLKRRLSRPQLDEPAEEDGKAASGSRTEQWTIESDPGTVLGESDALAEYQIVVLGRNAEVYLTDEALKRLRRWLAEGEGSLVCFRGAPASQISQRLGELMPVRWSPVGESRFRVELTEAGRSLRWLPEAERSDELARLPSLATVAVPESTKPLAKVLATAVAEGADEPVPVVTYQPVGSGRVVVVEGAGMWRWAFLPPAHQDHDETYGLFWRSLVRWLVSGVGLLPSQRLTLRTDKVVFSTTEAAAATLLVREEELGGAIPGVELSGGPLGEPKRLTPVPRGNYPGQYHVGFGELPEGHYRVRVLGQPDDAVSGTAAFDVRGNLRERLEVRARPDVMRLLADGSGGAVLETDDPEQLARQFDAHLASSRPIRTVRTTAWDRWWVLAGAFMLWGAAWGLRRRSGLV